ncbi:hypothetical protein OGAPHI_004482 [Ogataea philodendri]|uniref:Uncharacterized protein n=1 Tax=Ogataea philodendri TaxID=1378263 RepID=A0A9P8P5Q0_9ASCO|nr:uncharacterized protein OGAPHI_004482 [Ogataea philodendri]KAH3666293.1 hypothetical protein OGAPHI_004482 [Ogataea philodendri]
MSVYVDITDEVLVPEKVLNFVRSPQAGAIVYFGGITRDSFQGKEVVSLAYEAHPKLAIKTLRSIADESLTKFPGIHKAAIVHKTGPVPVATESVMIAVSSTHRKEGWLAGEWILERVKENAEIWKIEEYSDGSNTYKENETSNYNTNEFTSWMERIEIVPHETGLQSEYGVVFSNTGVFSRIPLGSSLSHDDLANFNNLSVTFLWTKTFSCRILHMGSGTTSSFGGGSHLENTLVSNRKRRLDFVAHQRNQLGGEHGVFSSEMQIMLTKIFQVDGKDDGRDQKYYSPA